ncbi:MAG: TetR family transcriptional regulator C-terminal domain-containing protein [Kofleriaceae bacterium]|nr:TetR family transcriptional regulator C-terminal domain-containing protein [Kofleriaceae bacterium]MCB9571832.1 TetR family transcriptional regulator C-terminal domain-containing protein [Kofleriaceae bacterium]
MPGRRASEEFRRDQLLAAAFTVATRTRLEGLTIRAVAREAGLSPGLVLFHFASRDALLIALLDRLLAETIVGEATAEILALPSARARLLALLARELELLPGRRTRLELFFDYWVVGIGHRAIRGRIQRALQRYRDAILPLAEAVVAEEGGRLGGVVTGADLAGLVVALIEGCVMQAVVDPKAFDVGRALTTIAAVIAPPPVEAAATAPARRRARAPARRR